MQQIGTPTLHPRPALPTFQPHPPPSWPVCLRARSTTHSRAMLCHPRQTHQNQDRHQRHHHSRPQLSARGLHPRLGPYRCRIHCAPRNIRFRAVAPRRRTLQKVRALRAQRNRGERAKQPRKALDRVAACVGRGIVMVSRLTVAMSQNRRPAPSRVVEQSKLFMFSDVSRAGTGWSAKPWRPAGTFSVVSSLSAFSTSRLANSHAAMSWSNVTRARARNASGDTQRDTVAFQRWAHADVIWRQFRAHRART